MPAHRVFQTIQRWYAVKENVVLRGRAHIGPGSRLWAPSALEIGDDVYIGKRCTVEVDGEIGAGTLIANNVGIVGRRDHDMRKSGVAVRRAPWVGDPGCAHLRTRVVIGSDVWIGYGAIILAPVTIGRGAVVAAGAVVVHDVQPYEIVTGNPAVHLAWRFDVEAQAEHERLQTEMRGPAAPPIG